MQPDKLGIQGFELLDGESVRASLGVSRERLNGRASQPDAVLLTETRVIHVQGKGTRRRAVFASLQDIDAAEIGYNRQGYGAFLWAALSFVIAALLYIVIDNRAASIAAAVAVAAMGVYLVIDRMISPGHSVLAFNTGGFEVRCSLKSHLPPEEVQAFINRVFELKADQQHLARTGRFAPR